MRRSNRKSQTVPKHRQSTDGSARPGPDGDAPLRGKPGSRQEPVLVVGVGASAGGLEACRKLVEALPTGEGIAFILVQHLDPTHQSMMVDLLRGHTNLVVLQAAEGMVVDPDHLYVIPPGTDLSILDGVLHLSPPNARHGARLPFDFLLNSLAINYGTRAACVILSGTGSDGSLGVRTVKAMGGLVLAQEPTEAGFDGMPRSAIATGAVDLVLPTAGIAETLVRKAQGLPLDLAIRAPSASIRDAGRLTRIIDLLRTRTPHDFRLYKNGTLERRIERRMALAGIKAAESDAYLERLKGDADELDSLAKDLLINVTSFFRDPSVFQLLSETVAPGLIMRRAVGHPMRVWSAGCSSGEEPYSLAMVLIEALEKAQSPVKLQLFASDVDEDAVAIAREGWYPGSIDTVVSGERLNRFFITDGTGYRVCPELRAAVIFTVQDLLADPPFSRLDLVSCRNLLIYLQPEAQAKVIDLFHVALNRGGLLLLGHSETTSGEDSGFEVLSKTERIYRRSGDRRRSDLHFPAGSTEVVEAIPRRVPGQLGPPQNALATLCESLILDAYAPAAVLINRHGECLFSIGPTDRFLKVAPGQSNHDLLAMARESVRGKLMLAMQEASREDSHGIATTGGPEAEGPKTHLQISVRPVQFQGESLSLVCFTEEFGPPARLETSDTNREPTQVSDLEHELGNTRKELQVAIRNLEISGAEQRAINEDSRSVTEEYQATNEELLASKEEFQSMNEELTALNGQLQETLERNRTTSNDLRNVLYSTRVATIFLDIELKIRLFTPDIRSLFNIIPSDIGRPLADLHSLASDHELLEDARTVISESEVRECEIRAENSLWYKRRIMPYRTHEDVVEGVVITFTDISSSRQAAQSVQAARAAAERANAAKSRFLAAASHDLRQPLQTLALVHGLLAKTVEGERAKRLVARLDDTLGAMAGMLNALLDINQIEAGTVHAEPVRFPINNLLDRLKGEFAYHARAKGLAFHTVPSGLWVTSDPRLLEQMMRNLIANALKYTETGSILVGCRRRSGKLSLEVWDSGIGIATEDIQAIFEEFHQLGNVARERSLGLGLGLSIVRSLSTLLGHDIKVRSAKDRGSVFSIEIALDDKGRPPESLASQLKNLDSNIPSGHRKGRILVIEDDPGLRELLEYALKHEGHGVVSASDGVSALDLVAKGVVTPELILADYNLPNGMNGLQVMAKMRAQLDRELPVIMLTGDISTETLQDIAKANCLQFNKPTNLQTLSEAIQTLLPPPPPLSETPHVTPTASGPVVYLVDDDPALRAMLREVLEDDGRVVEDYRDCEAFLAAWRPGVEACLLIDAYLPGMSGLDLLHRLKAEGRALPALMITGRSDIGIAVEAMKAGAADFLEKPVRAEELLAAIDRALAGAGDSRLIAASRQSAAKRMELLTDRQREIMSMVLAGHPSKNIAADLGISQRTVENHRAAIMKRTGADSLPALARLALAADLSDIDGPAA